MAELTRRELLTWSAKLAVLLGLETSAIPQVVEALETLASGYAPVLWLQGQACAGCSVSLLNSEMPGPAEILTGYISLLFHPTLSAATGDVAMAVIHRTLEQRGYYLAVEGSIPAGMPRACLLGEEPLGDIVLRAARQAQAVISVGSCAAFGGIPAAEPNPTGAVSVATFLKNHNVPTPVINVPGCPAHPDWIVGTLVHLLKFGMPTLDSAGRPTMFYGRLIHDQCQRFADYERERFATTFAEDGCLFKLGCLGPVTRADCTLRLWNGRTNYCIKAHAPCIGCASPEFASQAAFPFYTKESAAAVAGKGESV